MWSINKLYLLSTVMRFARWVSCAKHNTISMFSGWVDIWSFDKLVKTEVQLYIGLYCDNTGRVGFLCIGRLLPFSHMLSIYIFFQNGWDSDITAFRYRCVWKLLSSGVDLFNSSNTNRVMKVLQPFIQEIMMTLTIGNIFRITGLVWRESTGHHRSPVDPPHKTSDAEIWCFLWSAPEHTTEQTCTRDAGALRRHHAYYDVTVLMCLKWKVWDYHFKDKTVVMYLTQS